MNQPEASPAEVYEHYLGPAIAHPWTHVLLEYAAPRPGERVLDVACGTGTVARHAAPMVEHHGRVVALDMNADLLDVGRRLPALGGAAIEWRQGDAVRLDLPDGVFDLVTCQQGLQFFPGRAAALREMRRVLTGRGRIAISVWRALGLHPVYEALMGATARHLGAPLSAVDVSFSLWSADELRSLLSDAGFRGIEIKPRSMDVHLPEPDRFAHLTVLGAATSIPAFAQLDPAARASLVERVTAETRTVVQSYRDRDTLRCPMFTHITVAHSP